MKKITLAALLLVSSFTLIAQTTWHNDKAHSKLTFDVTHLGISDISGLFNDFDVSITANKADFSDAVFELTTDMATINTEVKMRDDHLRSADFFDVEKFPTMTFKSTSIQNAGKGKYKLTGNLTVRGITKTVTMDLWYRGTIENPQSKVKTAGFQLTGVINRSDFNIGPKFPEMAISEAVRIKADGEFQMK